jgi:alpha-ribazole phosphatase
MTQIDVIRHGEPDGGKRYRGHGVDDPLTETGWQQMWSAIPERPPWNQIISSPLSRCSKFSEALSDKFNIPLTIEEQMKEIGFGLWEGLTPEEIIANDSQALERFYQDPINNRPEGAEPLKTFSTRIWSTYKLIAEQYTGKHILIVAHAGVVRAITANILHMSLDDVYSRLKIEYASIICSIIDENSPPKLLIKAK